MGIAPQTRSLRPKRPKSKCRNIAGAAPLQKKWDYGDQRPSSVKDVALKAKGWKKVRWREGSKGWLESRFPRSAGTAVPWIRLMEIRRTRKSGCWWSGPKKRRNRSNTFSAIFLRATHCAGWCASPSAGGRSVEQDYHQLKEELGLDHYEGRSWSGWHHPRMTLVMLAYSFLTLETLRRKKTSGVDPAKDSA